MPLGSLIALILAVPAVISFIVVSLAFAYKAWKQTSIDFDAETISSLKDSIFALEKENARLKQELEQKDHKITQMQNELRENTRLLGELKGLISGDKKLTEVIGILSQFTPVLQAIEEFRRADVEILSKIDEIQKHLSTPSRRRSDKHQQ